MSRNVGNGQLTADFDRGRGPSLFPHVEALPPFGRLVDASSLLDDPLLRGLIESRPGDRLHCLFEEHFDGDNPTLRALLL